MSEKNRFLVTLLLLLIFYSFVFGCTVFNVLIDGHVIVGRNFDDEYSEGRLWFIPTDRGGMVIVERLGLNMPYEGMNSEGLFVAIAAVPKTKTPFSIFKPMKKSLEMVKLALEKAKTVDEALDLFSRHTVIFGAFLGYPIVHYMLVDRYGNSAIVEYVDGKMVVLKDQQARIMTNHFVSRPDIEPDNKTSFERYSIVKENIQNVKTIEDVQNLLNMVRQSTTRWSNVYDLNELAVYVRYQDEPTVFFSLKEELKKAKHSYELKNLSRSSQ